jgi:hypothetical protein
MDTRGVGCGKATSSSWVDVRLEMLEKTMRQRLSTTLVPKVKEVVDLWLPCIGRPPQHAFAFRLGQPLRLVT